MTRFIKIIKSKNGNMSFWAVVIALVICLIFEGIFEYIQVYSTASDVRTVIRRDLVSTAMQTAQDSYQSIKQYSLSSVCVNQTDFESKICSDLGLAESGNMLYHISEDADGFNILNPVLTSSIDTKLNLIYTFNLQVPVFYFGEQVGTADIPMTVNATYQFK